MDIVYKRNCVYQTAYHVVWCAKYRRKVLRGKISRRIQIIIEEVCGENGWEIISQEVQPDHIHLFVSIPPVVSISTAMKKLKGITARKLFIEFPNLKKRLWNGSLWSPSYYVGTAGNVSVETIKGYIERVDHAKSRR